MRKSVPLIAVVAAVVLPLTVVAPSASAEELNRDQADAWVAEGIRALDIDGKTQKFTKTYRDWWYQAAGGRGGYTTESEIAQMPLITERYFYNPDSGALTTSYLEKDNRARCTNVDITSKVSCWSWTKGDWKWVPMTPGAVRISDALDNSYIHTFMTAQYGEPATETFSLDGGSLSEETVYEDPAGEARFAYLRTVSFPEGSLVIKSSKRVYDLVTGDVMAYGWEDVTSTYEFTDRDLKVKKPKKKKILKGNVEPFALEVPFVTASG
jgi:hypothetical protein